MTAATPAPAGRAAFVVRSALVGFTLAALIGVLVDLPAFLRAYLIGWLLWLGVALGAFSWLCVHHLVGGRWGAAIRPSLAAACETLPALAVLFVPIALGASAIFPWTDAAFLHATPLRAAKAAYLDEPFFLARSAVALALWSGLGVALARAGDRLRPGLAAFGLIFYFLSVTTGAVDWVLSLDPGTSSSAFGLNLALGNAVAGLAAVIVVAAVRPGRTPLPVERVHELGTLLFASVMLWAYVAFTQYLLVWAADLPRQSAWYLARVRGPFMALAVALVALHFAAPFVLLLFRPIKRRLLWLAVIAGGLVVMHLVELCWWILPARALVPDGRAIVHWLDVIVPLGLFVPWALVFGRRWAAASAATVASEHAHTEGARA